MTENTTAPPAPKKKCFVVMGFGEKTDFATGRTLDLDKSYRLIIKKAVEDAGLECIRADDVIHAGIIDKPMYELLYEADLVVADLSTSNANAIYELGVRHALKPRTTIVIAESQFKFPFDIGHLLVRTYEHLGKGIDGEVADKMREQLKQAIIKLTGDDDETDSPVYTFLPALTTPSITAAVTQKQAEATVLPTEDNSATLLLGMFKQARKDSNWTLAVSILNELLKKRPKDDYLKQQLALAIYKSKLPTAEEALKKAKQILDTLNPAQTTDPETLGLWGAVYKRFWDIKTAKTDLDINSAKADLDEAIRAYEKGFYLKNDFYNGINFAFLLNVRASVSEKRDAIADTVTAERIRKRVIDICDGMLNGTQSSFIEDDEQRFWLQATVVEAYLGTGQKDKADELKNKIIKGDDDWVPEQWMIDSMNDQLDKLAKLLEKAPVID
ncbi:MAG TPA: TRAFs-binding domain-containing protein [Parafilimonas sp.]|nr:TRAFs-binding domain-containing protein [Parafilimonas sp.]